MYNLGQSYAFRMAPPAFPFKTQKKSLSVTKLLGDSNCYDFSVPSAMCDNEPNVFTFVLKVNSENMNDHVFLSPFIHFH